MSKPVYAKKLHEELSRRLTIKKLYRALRRTEWEDKTLSEFLDALELAHPELRETDEQLERGELIGLPPDRPL